MRREGVQLTKYRPLEQQFYWAGNRKREGKDQDSMIQEKRAGRKKKAENIHQMNQSGRRTSRRTKATSREKERQKDWRGKRAYSLREYPSPLPA